MPRDSQTILRNLGSQLDSKDAFLLGTDLVKDESTLVAAYDDDEGVTAAFNLNILNRLNKELGADFDLTGFRHCARWNPIESRIEMLLESIRCQRFRFRPPGLSLISGMAKLSIRRIVTNLLTRRSVDFCQTRASKLKPRGKMRAIGTH